VLRTVRRERYIAQNSLDGTDLFLNERKGRIQAQIFSGEEKQRLLAVAGGYLNAQPSAEISSTDPSAWVDGTSVRNGWWGWGESNSRPQLNLYGRHFANATAVKSRWS
jgi:hypothetical protein